MAKRKRTTKKTGGARRKSRPSFASAAKRGAKKANKNGKAKARRSTAKSTRRNKTTSTRRQPAKSRKNPARSKRSQGTRGNPSKRDAARRRIADLVSENRQLRNALTDVTRTRIGSERQGRIAGPVVSDSPDYGVPDGAVNVQYNSSGEVESFELPHYTGAEWDEIDWDEFGWEDIFDDVGDEEEDSYEADPS